MNQPPPAIAAPSNTKKAILAARNLEKGDLLFSKASGKFLQVNKVENRVQRTIVLLDGDMEIDFEAYCQLDVWRVKK